MDLQEEVRNVENLNLFMNSTLLQNEQDFFFIRSNVVTKIDRGVTS